MLTYSVLIFIHVLFGSKPDIHCVSMHIKTIGSKILLRIRTKEITAA